MGGFKVFENLQKAPEGLGIRQVSKKPLLDTFLKGQVSSDTLLGHVTHSEYSRHFKKPFSSGSNTKENHSDIQVCSDRTL